MRSLEIIDVSYVPYVATHISMSTHIKHCRHPQNSIITYVMHHPLGTNVITDDELQCTNDITEKYTLDV